MKTKMCFIVLKIWNLALESFGNAVYGVCMNHGYDKIKLDALSRLRYIFKNVK